MKVWVRSSSGLELEIIREDGMSPDGFDTLLRQVADTFQALIAIEVEAGVNGSAHEVVESAEVGDRDVS